MRGLDNLVHAGNKGSIEKKRLEKTPSFQKFSERNLIIANTVVELSREIDKPPAQVVLNRLRSKPGIIPILGARKFSKFEDDQNRLQWTFESKHLACLDEINRAELGLPMVFLHRKEVHNFLHGGMFGRITHH